MCSYWILRVVVLIVVHLINKIPSSHIFGLSPFENLYGYAPYYFSWRVFGCTCFVLHPHAKHSKLSFRSIICVYLWYGWRSKEISLLCPISHKLYVSYRVFFLEHIPFFSIAVESHNAFKFELVYIDPF